ncbi:hypothetical protein B0H14DRAFT_2557449 [Mycena olivaceomarginata]|nr:hypothetical protein B0H14DRAFT_2557449 [Mycena olivaceomarginata]
MPTAASHPRPDTLPQIVVSYGASSKEAAWESAHTSSRSSMGVVGHGLSENRIHVTAVRFVALAHLGDSRSMLICANSRGSKKRCICALLPHAHDPVGWLHNIVRRVELSLWVFLLVVDVAWFLRAHGSARGAS